MLSICFKHLPYNKKSLFIHSHRMYFTGFGDIQNISLNRKTFCYFSSPFLSFFHLFTIFVPNFNKI